MAVFSQLFRNAAGCRVIALTAVLTVLLTSDVSAQFPPNIRRAPVEPLSRGFLFPFADDVALPGDLNLTAETVSITNSSGHRLRGWLIPCENADQTILVCMGNTGNISLMLPWAEILHDAGFEVLLFDYQGYGGSEGTASAMSLYSDVGSAADYLIRTRRRDRSQIGVLGISLGSVLALAVTADMELGAVAVEDVFVPDDHVEPVTRRFQDDQLVLLGIAALRTLILPKVDPIRNVARLKCPVMLIHGEEDRLLPPVGTIRTAAAAVSPARVWIIPETGHSPDSLTSNDREYRHQLQAFYRDAFAGEVLNYCRNVTWTRSADGSDKWSVALEPSIPAETPCEVCCFRDGRTWFHRCILRDGEITEFSCPFEPESVTTISIRHLKAADGDDWEPDLSFRSQSRRRIRNASDTVYSLAEIGIGELDGSRRRIYLFSPDASEEALSLIPKPESVHPEIRHQWARLLARIQVGLTDVSEDSPLQAAELMLKFLPDDPDNCFEVGNASFRLGFRSTPVAECLLLLAINRLDSGNVSDAAWLLRYRLRVHPSPDSVRPDLQQIEALDRNSDLRQLSGREPARN